jgi:predicted SnoaL-like aldol condensation-catalyzing enzyme
MILFLVACSQALQSQAPVVPSASPESLFTSPDPALNANKQVVLHIVRDLLEAGHWADADKYLTERYIQHNPYVASGLAAVKGFFGSWPAAPIPQRMKTPVVSVTAENDLVVVSYVREFADPRNPSQCYTTTWFDMWRIVNGKADEHWDGATIGPPGQPPVNQPCRRPLAQPNHAEK